MENQDRQPTEVVITGVEIPLDDLAWLVTKIVVVAALVSAAVYLTALAAFALVAALLTRVT